MKLRLIRTLTVLLALAFPGAAAAQSDWTEAIEPFRIADNLFYVGTAGLGAYLLTTDQGHILIDAPLEENVPLVLANIRSLGYDPADIRIQLTSHAHYDHVGGLAGILAVSGADLMVSAADAPFVVDGDDFGLDTGGYPAATPARILEHLEVVRLADLELTAHLTPGHTPGCTTWSGTVEMAGEPVSFVVLCSLSVLDNYRLIGGDLTYDGQAADYCRSVAHARTLTPDIFLAGHGTMFGLAEKLAALRAGDTRAFVERERYPAFLDDAEAAIERVLASQGHRGGCAALTR